MDLRKEWQQLHQEKFNYSPIEKSAIMKAIYQESNSAISTLKTRLAYKLRFIIFFIVVLVIWMLSSLNRPELLMVLGTLFLFYTLGLIGIGSYYKKMELPIDFSNRTLSLMRQQDQLLRSALNFERIWGIVFYPIAAVSGMLVAFHYKGIAFAELFQDPSFFIKAIVAIIVLVPIGYMLSEKLNNSENGFGPLLTSLQNNIRRMEDLA